MAPSHFKGHQSDLPGPTGGLKGPLQATDLQHVDRLRAEGHRPGYGDGVDDPTVDEVLIADRDRRQDARHRAPGQHDIGQNPVGEPMLRGAF
jgi:hypothetical protein